MDLSDYFLPFSRNPDEDRGLVSPFVSFSGAKTMNANGSHKLHELLY